VLFFGTGFGPARLPMLPGALAPLRPVELVSPVEAQIGEIPLAREDVFYAGLAPGYAGLYQFNLRIPPVLPSGDAEVRVGIAGEWSQPGIRIPVER
jgi:uncharacterized protein (TIGR03437 family)